MTPMDKLDQKLIDDEVTRIAAAEIFIRDTQIAELERKVRDLTEERQHFENKLKYADEYYSKSVARNFRTLSRLNKVRDLYSEIECDLFNLAYGLRFVPKWMTRSLFKTIDEFREEVERVRYNWRGYDL